MLQLTTVLPSTSHIQTLQHLSTATSQTKLCPFWQAFSLFITLPHRYDPLVMAHPEVEARPELLVAALRLADLLQADGVLVVRGCASLYSVWPEPAAGVRCVVPAGNVGAFVASGPSKNISCYVCNSLAPRRTKAVAVAVERTLMGQRTAQLGALCPTLNM